MARECLLCGRWIEAGQPTKRGMHASVCYQRARRNGTLDSFPTRMVTHEKRKDQVGWYVELVGSGMTQTEACRVIGIAVPTMRSRLARRSLNSKGKPVGPTLYGKTEAIVEQYWVLRGSGFHELSMVEIAKKIGVSDRTLYRALKKVEYEW